MKAFLHILASHTGGIDIWNDTYDTTKATIIVFSAIIILFLICWVIIPYITNSIDKKHEKKKNQNNDFIDPFYKDIEPKTMYCKYCGTKIDDDSIYCKNCGQRIGNSNTKE